MITIVGTGHVLKKSVEKVRCEILTEKYEIIAVELDEERAKILSSIEFYNKNKFSPELFLTPSLIVRYILSEIQKEIGKKLNVFPGSEMKVAMELAKEKNLKIFLIDRNIKITMNHLMNIPLREKIKFLFFGTNIKKFDFENIESILEEENLELILEEIKKFPNLYNGLIRERDIYMAINLYNIQKNFPDKNILAIVGAGHKKGIIENLNKLKKGETIDLSNVLKIEKIPIHRKIENFLFATAILLFFIIFKVAIKFSSFKTFY